MVDDSTSVKDAETGAMSFGITFIRPCVTEAGKVSAETRLAPSTGASSELSPDFLDSSRLCWVLNISKVFSRVKCSEKLGIAKMEIDGKTVVVSKGGRINIRTARDKEDALGTTRLVSKALWPAMICSNCERAVIECVSGLCASCKPKECQLLTHGPPDPTRTPSKKFDLKTVRDILAELETTVPTDFYEARRTLDEAFQVMNGVAVAVSSGNASDNVESAVKEKLDAGNRMAQRLIVEGGRQIDVSGGLILLGVAANLEALNHMIGSFVKSSLSPSDRRGFKDAWNAVASAYETLWKGESLESGNCERSRESKVLRRLQKSRGVSVGGDLKKMGQISLHLSRMMILRLAV